MSYKGRSVQETFLSGDTSVGNTLSSNHSHQLTFHLKLGKAFPQILMSTSVLLFYVHTSNGNDIDYVHNKTCVDTVLHFLEKNKIEISKHLVLILQTFF